NEGGNRIRGALAVRDQIKHRVFRGTLLVRWVLRIRDHETTRAAQRRLVVASQALVAVEAIPQTGGVGLGDQLGLERINKRSQGEVVAAVANRFQLNGPLQAFGEYRLFVVR